MKEFEKINKADRNYEPEDLAFIQSLIDGRTEVVVKDEDGLLERGWRATKLGYDNDHFIKVSAISGDGTRMRLIDPDEFVRWQKEL